MIIMLVLWTTSENVSRTFNISVINICMRLVDLLKMIGSPESFKMVIVSSWQIDEESINNLVKKSDPNIPVYEVRPESGTGK